MTIKRDVVFRALVGSHNYNLDDQHSDRDYKRFVLPTFTDLYERIEYTDVYVQDNCDVDAHDIRKLGSLLWKSNVNFVETLFSKEIQLTDTKYHNQVIYPYLHQLFEMKNDIARMNLPYLYNACIGVYVTKCKQWKRDIQKMKAGGIDETFERTVRKQPFGAYRILDFLERFEQRDFKDFKGAIWYDENERELLDGLKDKKYKVTELEKILSDKKERVNRLQANYYKHKPNEATKRRLETLIYEMVYAHIKSTLNEK